MYCPSIETHYTEFGKYIQILKETKPYIVTTQSEEMIDILLASDLDFDVITVRDYDGEIKTRTLPKAEAKQMRERFNLELRL